MAYKEQKGFDNTFDASAIEGRSKKFWQDENVYQYKPQMTRENTFIVDTPPPTVSGSLHIGHIFSYTQTDIVSRFQRMQGKSVFYPIGWDDNGLPTERRIQNYYNIACNPELPYDPDFVPNHNPDDKSPRKEVSRRNFIEACEILTNSDESIFEDVFRNIGHSYDWRLKYTTVSPDARKISQESFIELFEKEKVTSVEAPTMWDVTFQSAISQAEIEDREIEGFFHDLKFKVEGSEQEFIISTTRPELLPACLAIVAHPDDERYKGLFGKKAITPLFDSPVPIIASAHAEKDKGTGIMMVCTFGDAADVAWWKTSGLPIKQIIGLDGRLLEEVKYGKGAFESLNPDKANFSYSQLIGKTTKQAKSTIVGLLREDGTLQGEPTRIMHPVKFYEKGSLPLEFVSSRQWFVKLMEEKQRLVEAGREIKWKPAHMQRRYEEWAEGLNQDWCVSRQRFFGVPFPVWYPLNTKGQPDYSNPIVADRNQLPIDPMTDVPSGFKSEQRGMAGGFMGDPDVMDTWATSALTPQIAMNKSPNSKVLSLPFDIRPQAHDIIRTWAFYTIAKSLLHSNTIPWKEALISGFILDPERKKMSKSKGNVVTPQHLIDEYSADAVRYWASKARLGVDTAFEEKVMGQGKKLAMKIFNASKFALNIVASSDLAESSDYSQHIKKPLDQAWMSKLAQTTEFATQAFKANDYASALEATETRFWDFCDNYLEIVKTRAYQNDKSAISSLMKSIDTFSKLFAPFCPFITEEVYQSRSWDKNNTQSLHTQHWPESKEFEQIKTKDSLLYDSVVSIVSEIRKIKTLSNKAQKTPIDSVEIYAPENLIAILQTGQEDIENVGNIKPGALFYKPCAELSVKNIELDLNFVTEKK